MDREHGPAQHLSLPIRQRTVCDWLRHGLLWATGIADPSSDFSVASGHVRRGPELAAARHNLLKFLISLIYLCRRFGVYFTIQDPYRSQLWGHRRHVRTRQ